MDTQISAHRRDALLKALHLSPQLLVEEGKVISRAVLTIAINLLLFNDLLERVPTGNRYVQEATALGRRIVFDHGALRTVALSGMGDLPAGEAAITRVLLPLGYRRSGVYPLQHLGMTGRSYTHIDLPEDLPQFFVSELHPEGFSPGFQAAVARITGMSRDPLSRDVQKTLQDLDADGHLHFERASDMLPDIVACFRRHHVNPMLRDYEVVLAESPEMAWIATEGNVFNHATDRVPNLESLVAEQRALGRPLKETIEISRSGRVRQTAFKADPIVREFVGDDGDSVRREVPGSFYEFIQREVITDSVTGVSRLDLAFDSANAQGIFKMTATL